MKHKTISSADFVRGAYHNFRGPRYGKHDFKATMEGKGIKVVDKYGNKLEVQYAGTQDNRTVYAYVEGIGFIGGWRYPHRKMPWAYLVESINRGIIYRDQEDLPHKFKANQVEDVMAEFIKDIEAVGIEHVRETWPDLAETYEKAKRLKA